MRIDFPATVVVISDTHGTLPARVVSAIESLAPSVIVHAGDVGSPAVLIELESLAPVIAVRGNTDAGAWAETLPYEAVLHAGDTRVVIVHDATGYRPCAGTDVLVSGHTHVPAVSRLGGILRVDPGSVSRPRAHDRIATFAVIDVKDDSVGARIIRT